MHVKFRFSEKVTQFDLIFQLDLMFSYYTVELGNKELFGHRKIVRYLF